MREIVWILLLGLLTSTGCRQLPADQRLLLKAAVRRLESAGAALYQKEQYLAFHSELQRYERDYDRMAQYFPWNRDIAMLRGRGEELLRRARLLAADTRRRQEGLRHAQQEQIRRLRHEISDLQRLRLRPPQRELLARAHLKLAAAESRWSLQDYKAAQETLADIDSLKQELLRQLETLQKRFFEPALMRLWENWAEEAVRWSERTQRAALVVDKYNRLAVLYERGKPHSRFPVELGGNADIDKLQQGDGATPEGRYRVAALKGPGQTIYFRALLLDYPNAEDRQAFLQARQRGLVRSDAAIGGLIEVHGEGGRGRDWTEGCIALTNEDMQALFQKAYRGMPVTIVGRITQ